MSVCAQQRRQRARKQALNRNSIFRQAVIAPRFWISALQLVAVFILNKRAVRAGFIPRSYLGS